MRMLSEVIYDTVYFLPYLIFSKLSFVKKTRILLTYFRLSLKLILLGRLFEFKEEKIFGFRIKFFNYRMIHLLFRVIFIRNEYFFKTNREDPVIFDCGANIGLATLYFKYLYPHSQIYAVEPDNETFNLLEDNVRRNNLNNVYLYNVALSDKRGKVDLHVDNQNPGSLRMSLKFERMPKNKIVVRAVTLSDLIEDKQLDFLKMDIEGAEDRVMFDLSENDKLKNIKEMVVEYHHKIDTEESKLSQFLSLLEDNGFEYQMDADCLPICSRNRFQNIIIYAYKE